MRLEFLDSPTLNGRLDIGGQLLAQRLPGDINGQLSDLEDKLVGLNFIPGLNSGTSTHRDGNQLDGIWTRNLQVVNTLVSYEHDPEVTDHKCILTKIPVAADLNVTR